MQKGRRDGLNGNFVRGRALGSALLGRGVVGADCVVTEARVTGMDAMRVGAVSAAGGPAAVVICGTDARYGTDVSDVVEAARAAGVSHVYLAGPEKALGEPSAGAPRPDEFLTAKIDAIDALSTLLTRLGA